MACTAFANGIATGEGGMHEEGFRKALTNVVNRYAFDKGVLKEKDDNVSRARTSARGSPRSSASTRSEPQFEGQTKGKLGNVSCGRLVERATNEKLAEWLEENPSEAKRSSTRPCQAAAGAHRGPPGSRR